MKRQKCLTKQIAHSQGCKCNTYQDKLIITRTLKNKNDRDWVKLLTWLPIENGVNQYGRLELSAVVSRKQICKWIMFLEY